MPIRTHRGRAAVWRRLWGWPLTSYRHLGVTVVAAAAAGLLVSLALGGQQDPAVPAPVQQPVQAQHPTPPPPPPRPAARPPVAPSDIETPQPDPQEPEAPAVEPAPPEALQVADAFAGRFATPAPGMSPSDWVDQLRPYVTPETAGLLSTVDPGNVQLRLAGPPQPTKVTPTVLHLRVPLEQGALQLVLVHQDRWLVRSYDEVS